MTLEIEKGPDVVNGVTAHDAHLMQAVEFLTIIGLAWRWVPGAKGFIDGVRVVDGGLFIDPTARVSNVLHEAGHLAILPGRFRRLATDDLEWAHQVMGELTDFSDPDAPAARSSIQCGDPEATAWAWAAGLAAGIPCERIIRDDEYDGTGRLIRLQLGARAYAGINGLASGGFCVVRPGRLAEIRQLPPYPALVRWLQLDFHPPAFNPKHEPGQHRNGSAA